MTESLYFLDNDDVLLVHRTLAKAIGLNRSIVLRQIRYWLELNRKAKKTSHFRDQSWWTYNTYPDWQSENFSFWSEDTIIRALESLRNEYCLVLATDQYNEKNYDRTLWYTIHYGNYSAFMRLWHDCGQPICGQGRQSDDYKIFLELWDAQRSAMNYSASFETLTASCVEPSPQVAYIEERNVRRPIPEINTETTNTGTRFLQNRVRGKLRGKGYVVPASSSPSSSNEEKEYRALELFILKAIKKAKLTEAQREKLWDRVRLISREGETIHPSPVDLYDDDKDFKVFAEEKVMSIVNASNGKASATGIVNALCDYGHSHGWFAYQKKQQPQERSQETKKPIVVAAVASTRTVKEIYEREEE